jgi:hypothetical protein
MQCTIFSPHLPDLILTENILLHCCCLFFRQKFLDSVDSVLNSNFNCSIHHTTYMHTQGGVADLNLHKQD